MLDSATYDDNHIAISEEDAIVVFHPERLKCGEVTKVSKSKFNKTRWQMRLPNTPLAVLRLPMYHNSHLCWWDGHYWVYITTIADDKKTCFISKI